MQENGIVSKVSKNGHVTVRLSRKTACENCRMCLMPRKEMFVQLKIKNTEKFKEGEFVSIVMPDNAVLKSAFLVYLLPIIVMTIVLFFTYKFDIWISLLSTVSSVLAVFIGVALLDKYILKKRNSFSPSMSKSSDISKDEQEILKSLILGTEEIYEDELGKFSITEKKEDSREKKE